MAAKARILAVDDQLYFRSFAQGLLSEAGYAVDTCERWDQALERLASARVDLVLVDPASARGADPLAEIRERWPETRVVLVSGAGDVAAAVGALKAGAADYLTKPVGRDALLHCVRGAFAPGASPSDEQRLVEENLEIIGRLSLLERSLSLLRYRQLSSAAVGLLELLSVETRAGSAVLWTQDHDGSWARAAVTGDATAPASFDPEAAGLDEALSERRAVLDPPEAPALLYVPCAADGRLIAVAQLSAPLRGSFNTRDAAAAREIGEVGALALETVRDLERLAGSSFRESRTGLPTKAFLDEVARTEVHKAQRYGRRLSLLCVDLERFDPAAHAAALPGLVAPLARTLRTTDILVTEGGHRFWVLVTDTDPLGGVVLKRRIAQRLREALLAAEIRAELSLGVASFPLDGDQFPDLCRVALERAHEERDSLIHRLGIEAETPLAEIGDKLLADATWNEPGFVGEVAELMLGELSCRPRDRGLLFLAPGKERSAFMAPLTALGDAECSTDVFLATDGDTLPSGPALTALGLPANVDEDMIWIVRFGEAPPYALVAGPPRSDGARPVFHSADPVLVEHMTFRLRAEIGFGVRA